MAATAIAKPAVATSPDWESLLASGNYTAAFSAANASGGLAQALDPKTLAKLYPKGMSQSQYEAFYSAFAPYEQQMGGQNVPQALAGGNANLYWNPTLSGSQIKADADQQYQTNTDLATVQADQAALKSLGGSMTGGSAFGASQQTPAQAAAQAKLQSDTAAYEHISGNSGINPSAIPTGAASTVADVYSDALGGGFASEKMDKSWLAEFDNSGGPLAVMAAIAAPELVPAIAGLVGGGAAATIGAGAAVGAGYGAAEGGVTGDPGKGALFGGITGGLGAAAPAISSATGGAITPGEASILAHTAGGAITGGTQGAENALIGGAVGAGLSASGATGALNNEFGSTVGGTIAKTGGSAIAAGVEDVVDPVQTSSLTPLYKGSTETQTGGSMATTPTGFSPPPINVQADVGGSDLSSLSSLTGMSTDPTLGMSSDPSNSTGAGATNSSLASLLGGIMPSASTLGGLAPYLAMGGAGLLEQSQAASKTNSEVNQLEGLATPLLNEGASQMGAYNSGTLTPAQSAVKDNAMSSGASLIAAGAPLSGIAATAFQQYQNGTLPAWQQTQLDQQTAAQKQQVKQSLASQGITDSSVLDAQMQQIDAQAAITKGQLNQQNFATGNQAYDTWLSSTTQGQQLQQQGLQYAAQSLQQDFANALGADSLGGQDVQSAIQLAVQSDTQLAEMMTQFMGSLATAYAIQQGGTSGLAGRAGGSSIPGISGSKSPSISVGGASTPGSLPNTSDTLDQASQDLTGNAALNTDFGDPNLASTLNNPAINSTNELGQTQMGGSYDAYQNPLNYDPTLGFGTDDISSGGF